MYNKIQHLEFEARLIQIKNEMKMIHWAAIWLAKLFVKSYSGFSLPLGQDGTDTKCDYNLFSSSVTQRWSYRSFPTLVILNEPRTMCELSSYSNKRLIIIFQKKGPQNQTQEGVWAVKGYFKMNREVKVAPLFPPSFLEDPEAWSALLGLSKVEHCWLGE